MAGRCTDIKLGGCDRGPPVACAGGTLTQQPRAAGGSRAGLRPLKLADDDEIEVGGAHPGSERHEAAA